MSGLGGSEIVREGGGHVMSGGGCSGGGHHSPRGRGRGSSGDLSEGTLDMLASGLGLPPAILG